MADAHLILMSLDGVGKRWGTFELAQLDSPSHIAMESRIEITWNVRELKQDGDEKFFCENSHM